MRQGGCPVQAIMVYLAVINLITFLIYGADKWKAVHHRWRVPEVTLILLAAAGGSAGAYLGMRIFHHKTRKNKFRIGIPAILFLQIAFAVILIHH